jgi:hypothetical protein
MKRRPETEEVQEAQKQTAVLMALLIAFVIQPSPLIRQRFLQHAQALGDKILASAAKRLEQFESKDPLLWLKLLRTVRAGAYDTETLAELGLIERETDFVRMRDALRARIMDASPQPNATWVMNEWSISEQFSTQTVLYGPPKNLALARTGTRGKRKLSVISHEGRGTAIHREEDMR